MSDRGQSVPVKAVDRERWAGIVFSFVSTFFYCISNIVIRYLAQPELGIEHTWILFNKELIGAAILLPWLFLRWGQGRFRYVSTRLVLLIVAAATVCQLIGAQLHVLGFAVIGLIITVPLIQSTMLLAAAIIGYFVFGNTISRWRKMAIAILIVAMTVLSIGKAWEADPQTDSNVSAGLFLLVALGTIVAGISYAVYVVMVRYVLRQYWQDDNSAKLSFKFRHWVGHHRKPTELPGQPGEKHYAPFPVTLAVFLVLAVGVVIFAIFLYCQRGSEGFYAVPHHVWYVVPITGVFNMIGCIFQLHGLRMTSAVQATLIAVSQILLLSLVGVLFFGEAFNVIIMIGLGLTVYGIFMSAKPERPNI